MEDQDIRLSAAAGMVATLAVGLGTLLSAAFGSIGVPWIWWVAYGVFVTAFWLDATVLNERGRWPYVVLAAMVLSGVVVWASAPGIGWSAILTVVTAASATYLLSRPAVLALVAGQTVVIAAGAAAGGMDPAGVVLMTMAYASFQLFAVILITTALRAARARDELAAAHAELRASQALLATTSRAAERLRIARELHDVMGHQLTALALALEVASHRAEGPAAQDVARARTITKELLADVRSTVSELRDVPAGLEPTLAQIVADVPGICVELTVHEDRTVAPDQAIAVVRCVQEVLTNTLRHAGARNLTIDVTSDEHGVRVRAEDDGRGVDRVLQGHGLTGMTERAEELGGTVSVQSRPGEGFRVEWSVPA